MKKFPAFPPLLQTLHLSVGAAAAFLISSCDKAPEAGGSPLQGQQQTPGPSPANTPEPGPGAGSGSASAGNSFTPAAGTETFVIAAREHFLAAGRRIRDNLEAKRDAAFAEFERKAVNDPENAIMELGEKMNALTNASLAQYNKEAGFEAKWEAKNWAGYPLPEQKAPVPVLTRKDYGEERSVPPNLSGPARDAWLDFWQRTDTQLLPFRRAYGAVAEAKTRAMQKALGAWLNPQDNRYTTTERLDIIRTLAEARKKENQAKGEADARRQQILASANAWHARDWTGYTVPADPNAPPPEPPPR